jgi:hypothetical protein
VEPNQTTLMGRANPSSTLATAHVQTQNGTSDVIQFTLSSVSILRPVQGIQRPAAPLFRWIERPDINGARNGSCHCSPAGMPPLEACRTCVFCCTLQQKNSRSFRSVKASDEERLAAACHRAHFPPKRRPSALAHHCCHRHCGVATLTWRTTAAPFNSDAFALALQNLGLVERRAEVEAYHRRERAQLELLAGSAAAERAMPLASAPSSTLGAASSCCSDAPQQAERPAAHVTSRRTEAGHQQQQLAAQHAHASPCVALAAATIVAPVAAAAQVESSAPARLQRRAVLLSQARRILLKSRNPPLRARTLHAQLGQRSSRCVKVIPLQAASLHLRAVLNGALRRQLQAEPAWVRAAHGAIAAAQSPSACEVNEIGHGGESIVFRVVIPGALDCVAKCFYRRDSRTAEAVIAAHLASKTDAVACTRQVIHQPLPTHVGSLLNAAFAVAVNRRQEGQRLSPVQLPHASGVIMQRLQQQLRQIVVLKHPPILYRYYTASLADAICCHSSSGSGARCPCGRLRALLLGSPVCPQRCLLLVRQCVQALHAHHSASVGVLHGDVKPANILFDVQPCGECRIVLSDYGLSLRTHDTSRHIYERRGTPAYRAPEVFQKRPRPAYSTAADVYGMGCALVDVLAGCQPPWTGQPERSLTPERIITMRSETFPVPALARVLADMIADDVRERRSLPDVLHRCSVIKLEHACSFSHS